MGKAKIILCSICLLIVGFAARDAGAVDLKDKVASVYSAKIGVGELTGKNDGAFVNETLSVTGLDNEAYFKKTGVGYEWCASFVSWTYKQAEVKAIVSAWAPSWFPTHKIIYIKGKPDNQIPQRADVFGIWSEERKLIRHVGFIDKWNTGDEYVITVEGNSGNKVSRNRRIKQNIDRVSRWIVSISHKLRPPSLEEVQTA